MDKLLVSRIIRDLGKLKTVTGKLSPSRFNCKENAELKQTIYELTSFLPADRTFSERVYCIENNIEVAPRCEVTGEYLRWTPMYKRYRQSKDKMYTTRVADSTVIKKRYKNIAETLSTKIISKDYNLLSKEEVLRLFSKYRLNIKFWDIEKDYNLFCSLAEHTSFLPSESQWKERFYCLQNNITERQISVDGGYSRYINYQKGYSRFSGKKSSHKYKIDHIYNNVLENFIILDNIDNLIKQRSIRIQCRVCNTVKSQLMICGLWQHIVCNKCTGYGLGRSKAEDEIYNFLTENGLEVQKNININGVEIDLFIPDKNIGIEYDGILWHSFGTSYPNNSVLETKNRYNIVKKQNICAEKNINLINIFENEWLLKQDIVKSILKSKLGLITDNIFARKCTLSIISKDQKKEFYIANHIQGNCQSFVDYGLFYNNELVAAMSFTRRKINKNQDVELARFCCKQNTAVVGGFSKLLKRAVRDLNCNIISYCDTRYSNGYSYKLNGFELIRVSRPNYFYTNDCITLLSRLNFQKHKLTKFENYDIKKTETQIMFENGYRKIYDGGNYVFMFREKK